MQQKAMEIFSSLSADDQSKSIEFMTSLQKGETPVYARPRYVYKLWWVPWIMSFAALLVSILYKHR